jgi:hypothetical protein
MLEANIDPDQDQDGRWTVELTGYHGRTAAQQKILDTTSPQILRGILEIWLKVVTPGARLIEPDGCSTTFIKCFTRSDQRRFQRTWGGRIVATAPPAATPSARHG